MRLLSTGAVVVLASLPVWASAGAVPELTRSNSVVAPLLVRDSIRIEGVGCGVPASATMALPANILDVKVRRPAVGTRDLDARITDVVVQANAVTFTAVADSNFVCDPNADPTPPASRPWSADFAAEVGAKRQAPATLRTDWYPRRRYVVRPRVVGLGAGPGLAENETVRRVTWKRFGGRKAVGFGIFKFRHFFCPSRDRCALGNGQRVRVELTLPSYCRGDNVVPAGEPVSNFVFYGKIATFTTRRVGVLKPGTEFESYKPGCNPGTPVRIR
jgi:hypothetical protein